MCQNYMGVWIFTMNRQCCIEAECLGLQRVHICVGLFHIRRIRCVGLFCIGVLGCFIFAGSVAVSNSHDQVCFIFAGSGA